MICCVRKVIWNRQFFRLVLRQAVAYQCMIRSCCGIDFVSVNNDVIIGILWHYLVSLHGMLIDNLYGCVRGAPSVLKNHCVEPTQNLSRKRAIWQYFKNMECKISRNCIFNTKLNQTMIDIIPMVFNSSSIELRLEQKHVVYY